MNELKQCLEKHEAAQYGEVRGMEKDALARGPWANLVLPPASCVTSGDAVMCLGP